MELFRQRGKGPLHGLVVVTADHREHIVRAGLGAAVPQPRVAEQREVAAGGHDHRRGVHSRCLRDPSRELHERQGIAVAITDDSRQSGHVFGSEGLPRLESTTKPLSGLFQLDLRWIWPNILPAGLPEDGFRASPVPGFGGAAAAAALIPRSNHE